SVQSHLASLDIQSDVAGAEVWIGGELVGRAPLAAPARVVAGEVTIELRAPGHATQRRTVRVAPGTSTRETFAFIASSASVDDTRRPDTARVVDAEPIGGTRTA